MVFNATFKNISAISWWSVLLMKETRVPRENIDLLQVTDNLYHLMLYQVHLAMSGFGLTTLVGIGTDCTGTCKSNYHTIIGSYPVHGEVYLIQHYMINFVSDRRQVGGFLWVLWFHSTNKKWLPWYNWNIVESGVKHHKSNQTTWPRRPLRYSIYIYYLLINSANGILCEYPSLRILVVSSTPVYLSCMVTFSWSNWSGRLSAFGLIHL